MKESYIETWHPIDGKWRHLFQKHKNENIKYYTDGIHVLTCDFKKEACIPHSVKGEVYIDGV